MWYIIAYIIGAVITSTIARYCCEDDEFPQVLLAITWPLLGPVFILGAIVYLLLIKLPDAILQIKCPMYFQYLWLKQSKTEFITKLALLFGLVVFIITYWWLND